MDYLKATVRAIVSAMADTQKTLQSVFPQLSVLPQIQRDVSFVTSQELEDLWPDLHSAKERENDWVKDHPTTFLMQHRRRSEVRQAPRRPRPRLRRLDPERRHPLLGRDPGPGH